MFLKIKYKIRGINQTLRRIKPNSRALLIGEQPNPSKLLLLEERTSRHRNK
jgi:hypothetical protein